MNKCKLNIKKCKATVVRLASSSHRFSSILYKKVFICNCFAKGAKNKGYQATYEITQNWCDTSVTPIFSYEDDFLSIKKRNFFWL